MRKPPNNLWQFLYFLGDTIANHGTRMLGLAQGTVALIASMDGIIPPAQLKYYLMVSAVLTFWRGQANANKIRQLSKPKPKPKRKPKR